MSSRYSYDPRTDTYTIPSSTLQRMIYRIGKSKEEIASEDARENERRIRDSRR